MKTFHCDACKHLVFFENTFCVECNATLAFLPDENRMGSLRPQGDGTYLAHATEKSYRLCKNYSEHEVCNWAVPASDSNPLCECCQLTRTIPDLSQQKNILAWVKLESAKRRLVYTLRNLGLQTVPKTIEPETGLAFDFLADPEDPNLPRVLTGQDQGLIVINVAEADDATREKMRAQLREPYRTLIGHFRHEIGHYYWDRLIADRHWEECYRKLFGDERASYEEALQKHYTDGAPKNWRESFISEYATMHPWEDWAESFAHYLHMTDTLETAAAAGLSLKPNDANEPTLKKARHDGAATPFDTLIEQWYPLTQVLNNLNRSLGQPDGYPFVMNAKVVDKLRFVHETITGPDVKPERKKAKQPQVANV